MMPVTYGTVLIVVLATVINISQTKVSVCGNGNNDDTCHCGHCYTNTTCVKQTGICPNGCKPGYKGSTCTSPCDNGNFGENCAQSCNCNNTSPCNKVTGHCFCIVTEVVPENGKVDMMIGSKVSYVCNHGYSLIGKSSHTCLSDGTWNRPAPRCLKQVGTCPEQTDSRGTFWSPTRSGNIQMKACSSGYTGKITRHCNWDGTWFLPRYNCVRAVIQQIYDQVGSMNSSYEDTSKVLENMVSLTNDNTSPLTDGELGIMSTSLDNVANVMLTSDIIQTQNITNHFLESVNNLIDSSTHDDWRSLNQAGDTGAVKILSAVDTFTEYLGRTLKSTNTTTLLAVHKNLAIQVKLVTNTDVVFPDSSVKQSVNHDWVKSSTSNIILQSAALDDSKQYVTTAVMYKDMSEILPTTGEEKSSETHSDQIINGPILSLSISPPVHHILNPPVKITFQHKTEKYNMPACSFWKYDNLTTGYWSDVGCNASYTNRTLTQCECNHLTNFAVLMSPFKENDETSFALEMISILGMSVSIVCLVVTFGVHLWLWKYLKKGRTYLLMHLCGALIASYVLFLAGVDRTENKTVCTVVAALLHYIFLVVFFIMLAEGIEIAITILYVFQTRRSVVKWLLFGAWGIPAVIVGISLGVTKLEGFGNNKYCWLSVDSGLIWAFVGPALTLIGFNIVCLCLVLRALCFTRVMEMKRRSKKVMTGLRSLCVLIPVTGVSWILGIFYISDNTYFMQYIFAICNGLQGVFLFLFHCLLNPQVKIAMLKKTKKYSVSGHSKSVTSKAQTYTDRISKGKKELKNHCESNNSSSHADGFLNNTYKPIHDSQNQVLDDRSVNGGSNIIKLT